MKKLIPLFIILLVSCSTDYEKIQIFHHIIKKEVLKIDNESKCRVITDNGDTIMFTKCPKCDTLNYFYFKKLNKNK